MTPEELELKKLELASEDKRIEMKSGIYKVALGTGLVGLATAFFPFAQEYATQYYAAKVETLREKTKAEIQLKESELQDTSLNRDFLASVAKEGRSKNLTDRIILAEYYYYLSNKPDEQERWKKFLDHLIKLQKEQRDAEVKAARLSVDESSSASEVAAAQAEARLLRESSLIEQPTAAKVKIESSSSEINILISELSSDEASIRRGARTKLAEIGVDIIRPAMDELNLSKGDYRMKLGLLVAIAEMFRNNKNRRSKVIDLLSNGDLENLVVFATDSDRNVRIYAGEFLYDLGDPRLFDIAVKIWKNTSSDNGKFNLALIIKGCVANLDSSDKANAKREINKLIGKVGPKTDGLLNDAISRLK